MRDALRTINQFRNRFAHVPFPYDPLPAVSAALTACTDSLFQLDAQDTVGALRGGILVGRGPLREKGARRLLQGGGHYPAEASHFSDDASDPANDNLVTHFVHGYDRRDLAKYSWSTSGFVHVDDMLRPYALTRVLGDDFADVEYTRYLAEANALVVIDLEDFPKTWPRPSAADYEEEPSNSSAAVEPTRMGKVVAALRRGDFDAAIQLLEAEAKDRPNYHIAWLKLSSAYREKAVRMLRSNDDIAQIADLLKQSIEAAVKASGHLEAGYRAEASYQESKSLWRLSQIQPDGALREQAKTTAKTAVDLAAEDRFVTWLERITRDDHRPPPPPPSAP